MRCTDARAIRVSRLGTWKINSSLSFPCMIHSPVTTRTLRRQSDSSCCAIREYDWRYNPFNPATPTCTRVQSRENSKLEKTRAGLLYNVVYRLSLAIKALIIDEARLCAANPDRLSSFVKSHAAFADNGRRSSDSARFHAAANVSVCPEDASRGKAFKENPRGESRGVIDVRRYRFPRRSQSTAV